MVNRRGEDLRNHQMLGFTLRSLSLTLETHAPYLHRGRMKWPCQSLGVETLINAECVAIH